VTPCVPERIGAQPIQVKKLRASKLIRADEREAKLRPKHRRERAPAGSGGG
jgi:hypothetical protein